MIKRYECIFPIKEYSSFKDAQMFKDDGTYYELGESFSKEKPKPESGYTIKKTVKKINGKVQRGWEILI